MTAIKPQKWLGQNFLMDNNIARKIADSIDIKEPSLIIEIGPGTGALTQFILPKAQKYIGVEVDNKLAEALLDKYSRIAAFSLIQEDVLKLDLRDIIADFRNYCCTVIGNIPYNITSPIIFKLFDIYNDISEAVIMVQFEVARRITASPGTKDYGILSIFSQIHADVNFLFKVPPTVFFPAPKVDSAVIKYRFYHGAREPFADYQLFSKVIHICFQHRRKMLRNSLSLLFSKEVLTKLNIDLSLRPEQLSVEQWKKTVNDIHSLLL
jgi:16S rRNA (adenine1518-N6/adenine1519-N6)-dimethyltransferase